MNHKPCAQHPPPPPPPPNKKSLSLNMWLFISYKFNLYYFLRYLAHKCTDNRGENINIHMPLWALWHIRVPLWHIRVPLWHIRVPLWHIRVPLWHIRVPLWHIRVPLWHIRVPFWHIHSLPMNIVLDFSAHVYFSGLGVDNNFT